VSSELKTNKVSPATGTEFTLGDSGDTFTLPSGGTLTVASGATITNSGTATGFGKVLQVVSATKTDTASTTSTSFVTTGLEVTITPSATSSKILLIATPVIGSHMDNNSGTCFLRNSTAIGIADAASSRSLFASHSQYQYASYNGESAPITYLDSPSSTSAITYKVAYKMGNIGNTTYGTLYLNQGIYDTDNANYARSSSTIIAMEIGA